ncbi:hypothetical protein MRX96_046475 [Rhipicephalus microplus]
MPPAAPSFHVAATRSFTRAQVTSLLDKLRFAGSLPFCCSYSSQFPVNASATWSAAGLASCVHDSSAAAAEGASSDDQPSPQRQLI